MPERAPTPLIRLGSLFPDQPVFAKCEFAAPSGCFKIRGANYLLERLLREGRTRHLVVPSMGNTALGAATAAKTFGFTMTGVVPENISRDKDEKLRALGADLVKLPGGGSELLLRAREIADETGGYFVHPHLDPNWTDGYQSIAAEVLHALPDCRTIVFPVGGGGLLLGLLAHTQTAGSAVRLIGCEPHGYAKYAKHNHERTGTIADGLRLETPHPHVQAVIAENGTEIDIVSEAGIRLAMRELFDTHALVIEPSSAVPLAYLKEHAAELQGPICAILTGENIALDDHRRLISTEV